MKNIIIAATIAIALSVIGFSLLVSSRPNESGARKIILDLEPYCDETAYLTTAISEADPFIITAQLESRADSIAQESAADEERIVVLKRGDTLHSILRSHKITKGEIGKLAQALRPHLRPSELTPDDELRFFLGDTDGQARLETLSIRKEDQNRIPIIYRATRIDGIATESDFKVEVIEPQIEERLSSISLKVQGTLYQTFSKVPFGNELMQRLMGIFTWQMQMPRDVRSQDEIELLVIEKYVSGKLVGYGKIQSAFYRQPHQELFAIFFVSKDQSLQGFFDQNGKSLEREFSVSPVYETTATSNQKWRLHPIKKRRIRHNGTDYRGSIGTDFFSIADGVVTEKRFDRNVGNMIRVKHRYGVYSEYFHADRLEPSLKISDRVKRGQKLGTIGRTGRLCTGPHLHLGIYRMEGNTKRFINVASMRKILKPAPDIDLDHLAEFNFHLKNQLAKMDAPKKTVVAEGSDTVTAQ